MLEIKGLTVAYGDIVAIKGLDLTIERGEIVCLLGPSGCGKSTLLRVIAGLEPPRSGTVTWDGQDLASLPVHRRGFGLMFQDYALFPHRTVARNVAFGLEMMKQSKTQIAERVEEVLALVGLDGYGDRTIGQLSGGQLQRVALARSIAPSPHLLMFDEPLGSLDRSLRDRLVVELHDILNEIGATSVYVTHDQEEAFALADRVLLLRDGEIEQIGSPEELWSRPRTPFTAHFLGFRNFVTTDNALRMGWPVPDIPGNHVVYRPDGFSLDDDGAFEVTTKSRTYRGDHFLVVVVAADGTELEVVVRWQPVPQAGEQLRLAMEPSAIVPVDE
jgi:thiamine transport system ATP-binding protein